MLSRRPGITTYDENPFITDVQVSVGNKRITVHKGTYVDAETGETAKAAGIHVVKKVDREQFVKLYTSEMWRIFELKPTTRKVVQYLLNEVQKHPNADGIYLHWLNAEKYLSEQEISIGRSSFNRAMREMLEKQLIAESTRPNLYWINPAVIWNGDRYRFIREYEIEKPFAHIGGME